MRKVKTLGLLGTGVIGGGWSARALHFGIDVIAVKQKTRDRPIPLQKARLFAIAHAGIDRVKQIAVTGDEIAGAIAKAERKKIHQKH